MVSRPLSYCYRGDYMINRYEITEKKLPMIPLRGMWVFPSMVVHFDVGRDKSIKALEKAMIDDSLIFLTSQKDYKVEDPEMDDVYDMGTIAEIKQTLKLPNGSTRVLIEGKERAKLLNMEDGEYLVGDIEEYEYIDYDESEISDQTKAAMRLVVDGLTEYASLNPQIASEVLLAVIDIEDPGRLADVVASYMELKMDDHYEVLKELDPYERLEKLHVILQEEIELSKLEANIDKKVKKNIDKSQRDYYLREQLNVIKSELGDAGDEDILEQYLEKIEETNMPDYAREVAIKEAEKLATLNPNSPEVNVSTSYLDYLIELPWNIYTESDIDIKKARKILDEDHFGLKDVKERVLEHLAVIKKTDKIAGSIICLTGPPGVGKTSIARSISRAMGREFVSMRLGGVRDEAEIRGHRKTYIGAMPGRIITLMTRAGAMNPVFLLDEIDKLASDFRGDPASALLEVLDPEQNDEFTDHYIEIPFDLSNVMFITTANDVSLIPDALRDRMEIINISGYTAEEKFAIATEYLIPKNLEKHGASEGEINISDNALRDIIQFHTRESGVRELERIISRVIRRAIKKMLEDGSERISVTVANLDTYADRAKYRDEDFTDEPKVGVVTGLAWTRVGGEILQIETNVMPGTGKVQLTGQLGDVMKESAMAGASYIRSNADKLGIKDKNFYKESDIHIHIPEGAIPKDGPSAGTAMTIAMISALTGRVVRPNFAMTGEITLTGRVLPIGGVKEKTLAARRYGIKNIILPTENKLDVEEIDSKVLSGLKFHYVKDISQIIDLVLEDED